MKKLTNYSVSILLMAIVCVSCSKGDDNNSNNTQREQQENPAPNPTPAPAPAPSTPVQYSAFQMNEQFYGFSDLDTDFEIKMQFNKRPLVITSNFLENTTNDFGDILSVQKCNFSFNLTNEEADKLESYAKKIKICEFYNQEIADGAFSSLDVTDSQGKVKSVLRYKSSEVTGKHLYLCGGKKMLYQYVGDLVKARAPVDCPESYKDMFSDQ